MINIEKIMKKLFLFAVVYKMLSG